MFIVQVVIVYIKQKNHDSKCQSDESNDLNVWLGVLFSVMCLCSAGVGRTGVFITLSIVLERMRYEGVVDIFQTVKMLRTQRPAMVQTEVHLHTVSHMMPYSCPSIS